MVVHGPSIEKDCIGIILNPGTVQLKGKQIWYEYGRATMVERYCQELAAEPLAIISLSRSLSKNRYPGPRVVQPVIVNG
jgi:hypothetical protein